MAYRDFLHAPQEAPTGCCEAKLSRGANAFLASPTKEVLPPYMRNDAVQDSFTGAVGLGYAGETDLILDLPPAVKRPDFDELPAPGTRARPRRPAGVCCGRYGMDTTARSAARASASPISAGLPPGRGIRFESDEPEHGIHGRFVQLAAKGGRVAKLTHKILDRKYRTAIERFRRAKSESQVGELWSRALADGDVPGPYWALMTHPRSTPALMILAFGEVHMLSHLAGATKPRGHPAVAGPGRRAAETERAARRRERSIVRQPRRASARR